MRIVLLCATRRGELFLERLAELAQGHDLTVFSFREEAGEPPFLDNIKSLAERRGAQFKEARQVAAASWAPFWEKTPVDLMLVVSWRYLIPERIYRKPRRGTFVFHDSPLPKYRGFAPTVWAIRNGEAQTGATLFEIADEVDSGDVVDQQTVPIGPEGTIAEVMEEVTQAYLTLLARNLNALLAGTAPRTRQDHSQATFTCKRVAEDNRIDWTRPTADVHNLIRAVTRPYPGAYTQLNGNVLRVWEARRLPVEKPYVGSVPGRVAEIRPGEGVVVLTGDGSLLVTRVQREGGEVLPAAEVLNSINHTLGR